MPLQLQPGRKRSAATIDAISEETDALLVHAGSTLSFSISGTYTGTIQLQRSFDGVTFYGVEDYAATGASNTQKDIIAAASVFYKLVASAWTSGSADVTLVTSS